MQDYAFTVKFNETAKKDCVPSDYDTILDSWKKRGIVIDIVRYETDSKGVCHAHGICQLPAKFYIKQLIQKGVHYKLDPITDRNGWINYINKQQKPKRMMKIITYKNDSNYTLNPKRNGSEESREKEVCSTPDLSEDEDTSDLTEEVLKHIKRNLFATKV